MQINRRNDRKRQQPNSLSRAYIYYYIVCIKSHASDAVSLKSHKFAIKQAVILKRCDVWNRDRLLHVSNEIWATHLSPASLSLFTDDTKL